MADVVRKIDCLHIGKAARPAYLEALKEDMQEFIDECHYTPDATAIQRYETADVFVIGTMKKGFRSHHHVKNGIPLGVGWTNSDRFRMWKTTSQLAPYPVVLAQATPHLNGRIYGEIWRLPVADLFKLDFYESNTVISQRRKIPIDVHTDGKTKLFHYAWMYIGLRSYWDSRIGRPKPNELSLEEVDLLTPNRDITKKYYNFMKKYEPKKD